MVDIVALVHSLQPHVTATTRRHFSRIAMALVVMTGRVTMFGLSRWAGTGGSSRTVQRFFATVMPWATLFWVFFHHHVYRSEESSLRVGDEVVVTKAGKTPHGLDRCFASLYGKPVPGLAFFTLSWGSIQRRRSFPLRVEQVVRSDAEQAASKAKAAAKKTPTALAGRRPGRPQGSKNTPKADVTLTPELWRLAGMLGALWQLIAGVVSWPYVGLDGHFGNHNALPMARQHNLPLMSTRRCDAALYVPYTGPYAGRGPHRKSGDKGDYDALPMSYLKENTVAGHMKPCVSQMQLLQKEFTQPLHVVIIAKTNRRPQARAHVVLFSSDLALADAPLGDYYSLRCQIECHVRDAKQYWGLEGFMNVTPTGVTNAANLSLFRGNVADHLRADGHPQDPDYSILDLQAVYRGYKYVEEPIKMLPEKPEPVLLAKILNQVASLGRLHAAQPSCSFS